MRKRGCIVCMAAVIGIMVALFSLASWFFGTDIYESEDIAYYQGICGELDAPDSLQIWAENVGMPGCDYALPTLEMLEPYENTRFHYQVRDAALFQAHAFVLIVEYSEQEYKMQKEAIENTYFWRTEGIEGETENVLPEFNLDGFDFRSVSGGYYPNEMFLLGTCDEAWEIAYIYFYDGDLDYVNPDMAGFLRDETGWNEVVGK